MATKKTTKKVQEVVVISEEVKEDKPAIVVDIPTQEEVKKIEPETKEVSFPTPLIVKSKSLAIFNLHPDVIRAILVKDSYTMRDAVASIQKYIDSFKTI